MNYNIRTLRNDEYELLNNFLYEAIFIPAGVPSFAISLYKEYRGCGIGTALMKKMIQELKIRGYEKASLSVQKANYAVTMYKNVGFEIVDENEEEYMMVCRL